MNIISNSFIIKVFSNILLAITSTFNNSFFKKKLDIFINNINLVLSNSKTLNFIFRESQMSKNFDSSYTLKIINFLINIPGLVLNFIYKSFKNTFDNSVFSTLIFHIGTSTSILIGWFILVIFIFPYQHWNNAYSLITFIFATFVFLLGSMRYKNFRIDIKAIGPYTLFFMGSIILALAVSYSTAQSFRYFYFHLSAMLCVILVVSSVRSSKHLRRLAGMTTLSLFFIAIYGVIQGLIGVEINTSYVDLTLNADMPGRVFGMYDNPNAYAEVLVMLIPVSLGLIFSAKHYLNKFFSLLCVILGLIALGMTYSRASFIGIAIAFFCFVFLWKKHILPFFIILALFSLSFLPSSIYNRILTIFNFSDTSTASRFPLYQAAFDMLSLRPFRGVGLGGEVVQTAIKDFKLYSEISEFVHSHNMMLQIWLETGIIGITTFLASLISNFKHVCKLSNSNCPSEIKFITFGATSAMVGILINGIADYPWHYPRMMIIFWFVFAIMLSGIKLANTQTSNNN